MAVDLKHIHGITNLHIVCNIRYSTNTTICLLLDSQSHCFIKQLRMVLLWIRWNKYVINGFRHDEITEFIREIACH